ncbi:CIC11C00000002607 [Sungouiella intermedia]|uniref:CIC11C00000002607 n=1 Tax=Sungouiella intermedia TaxID=45354 RepID=A0A1L0GMW3_9ASCO|nr:CIC11C00000002607 [[Candida] intermedia]
MPVWLVSKIKSFFKMFTVIGVSIGGLALVALYTFQSTLIYPSSLNDGKGHCATPDELDMPDYEELFLRTEDGESIQCYALKHDRLSPLYTNKTVLILSPNAGNIGHALPIVSMFYKNFQYNVFIYSYRGYGKSSGRPLEIGLKVDAQRVMKYITTEDEQLLQSSLVLYGRSLGGAVLVYISSIFPSAILGIILENTFLLIPKTVPHIFPALKYFTILVHQKWNTEVLVPQIPSNIPVLLFSARRDEIVPPSHMDRIFQLLRTNDKVMYKYDQAAHNDTVIQPGYWERVHEFIQDKVNPAGY